MVKQEAQHSLGSKTRVRTDEPPAWVLGRSIQITADRVARRKAMLERGVNTASGDRRNHASGVSHEQHARCGDRADKTSARNHSCPHRNGTQPAKIVYRCNLVQEGRHHRILHRLVVTSKTTGKPYLNGV